MPEVIEMNTWMTDSGDVTYFRTTNSISYTHWYTRSGGERGERETLCSPSPVNEQFGDQKWVELIQWSGGLGQGRQHSQVDT